MREARLFSLLLNAHQPYLTGNCEAHDIPTPMYETVRDSYLQIIQVFRKIAERSGKIGMSVSVSPTLLARFSELDFNRGFLHHMDVTIKHLTGDLRYFAEAGKKEKLRVAEYWLQKYDELTSLFNDVSGDIVSELSRLERHGLELITSMATDEHLPLLANDKRIKAQIGMGAKAFEECFGHEPGGIWIPGTTQGARYDGGNNVQGTAFPWKTVEDAVTTAGFRYFVTDEDAGSSATVAGEADNASMQPDRGQGTDAPCDHVHGDEAATVFVASAMYGIPEHRRGEGYASHPDYLDCSRKNIPGGIRYWRQTAGTVSQEAGETYVPEAAGERAAEHASDFLDRVVDIFPSQQRPVVALAMDIELFGNLWFEGPSWISCLYGKLGTYGITGETIGASMPADRLNRHIGGLLF